MLTRDQIPWASTTTVEAWDSIATATLVSLMQEEFGIQVAPEELDRFVSFREVLAYLQSREIAD